MLTKRLNNDGVQVWGSVTLSHLHSGSKDKDSRKQAVEKTKGLFPSNTVCLADIYVTISAREAPQKFRGKSRQAS